MWTTLDALLGLDKTVCLPAKALFGVAVAVAAVLFAVVLSFQGALSQARAVARSQARQSKKQSPPQQQQQQQQQSQTREEAPDAAAAASAPSEEVTVSTEELATAKQFGLLDGPYKMVLCVNMNLKMEKGKIAAQCGHATLACYKKSLKMSPTAVSWWERLGQAKIALKVPDEAEMAAIQEKARALGLATYIVEDAGRTQIAAGSRTVLGIGPAPVKVIDSITSHLKLL